MSREVWEPNRNADILCAGLFPAAALRLECKALKPKRQPQGCDSSTHWFLDLITLSARSSTLGGIVRPICFAVLRLTISSNFVDIKPPASTSSRSSYTAGNRFFSAEFASRVRCAVDGGGSHNEALHLSFGGGFQCALEIWVGASHFQGMKLYA